MSIPRVLLNLSTTPAEEYKNAEFFSYLDLIGSFRVTILSGPFKLYTTDKWIKCIDSNPVMGISGHNEIAEFETDELEVQGHFNVSWTSEHVMFDYNIPENKKSPWLRMKDHIRITNFPGEYIGKIFVKIGWIYWPAGYFALSKIQGGHYATRK